MWLKKIQNGKRCLKYTAQLLWARVTTTSKTIDTYRMDAL